MTTTELSLTALNVADLDRAVRFYVDALGFTEGDRFSAGEFDAAIVRAGAGGLELMLPTGESAGRSREHGQMFGKLVLSVDDVEARVASAAGHGGEVVMPATEVARFGMIIGMVRDPDGYLVEMTQRLRHQNGPDEH
ncbi:VOC family protein [Dietzia sp. CH92]|uniref:VOC family protein n=1 Tax=Dietzia sp. CH92 TaxID=3051823 RepID=UPI0028D691B7|nr:VOC family protein [Dietzia sp. CH92]